MKKIIAMLLAAVTLLSLLSCGTELESGEATGAETATGTPVTTTKKPSGAADITYPKIAKPLTQADFDAIPIANNSMTEEELRQICIDFMQLQLSFLWTPNKSFDFYTYSDVKAQIKIRVVYGGMPYVSNTTGNLYQLMHYYDQETGIMDTAAMGQNAPNIMGNQCSGNSFWGWARVCNSMSWGGTPEINPAHGAVMVGPFTFDSSIQNYHSANIYTPNICKNNGEQVMYRSYAATKPADGLVWYDPAVGGHVMMITGVHVEEKDGAIDGQKSYVTYQDQAPSRTSVKVDGQSVLMQIGYSRKSTFEELYKEGSLPFTLKELIGQDPVEKATADFSHKEASITFDQLNSASLNANYAISHVTMVIRDKDGNETYSKPHALKGSSSFSKSILFSELGIMRLSYEKALSEGATITLTVQLGNGEQFEIYSGLAVK
ncbi:MAG: hypothetical protein IJC84_04770 [Clostridia bacterium]|nr:hypothetical protein [Clostridia bacterium]